MRRAAAAVESRKRRVEVQGAAGRRGLTWTCGCPHGTPWQTGCPPVKDGTGAEGEDGSGAQAWEGVGGHSRQRMQPSQASSRVRSEG